MPSLRPVNALKHISCTALAYTLASCISLLAAPETAKGIVFMEKEKPKTPKNKLKKKWIPQQELKKIQAYIYNAIPMSSKESLLHNTLLLVAELITMIRSRIIITENGDEFFLLRTLSLQTGLTYTFDLLFDSDIRQLNLTELLHLEIKWVNICRVNNRDTSAKNISYARVESAMLKLFGSYVSQMVNLEYLVWPHLISGELVRLIGRHCSNLRELILACGCDAGVMLNEDCMEKFQVGQQKQEQELIGALPALYSRAPGDFTGYKPNGCPKLKVLNLPLIGDEEEKAASVIAEALCNLKYLETVSGIPMLLCLNKLHKLKDAPPTLLLKIISDEDSYRRRFLPDAKFLRSLLPNLRKIEILVSKHLTVNVLEHFYDIKNLKIEWPDFQIQVKKFTALESIDINLDFQCAWPLLVALSQSSQQLESLTLVHPSFHISSEHEGSVRPPKLEMLHSFRLVRSSFIEYAAFKKFLSVCSSLQTLSLTLSNDRNYGADEMKDDLIKSTVPYLEKLENFIVECQYKYNMYHQINCLLSMESAEAVILNCPSIKFIGHLECWDVKDEEISLLMNKASEKNWNLEIA